LDKFEVTIYCNFLYRVAILTSSSKDNKSADTLSIYQIAKNS